MGIDIRYVWRFVRSVLNVRPWREWSPPALLIWPGAVVGLVFVVAAFQHPGSALGSITGRLQRSSIDNLVQRAERMEDALQQVDSVYEEEIAPLERVLLAYNRDTRLARRVATALTREAKRAGVTPDILLAVLLVENPWIDPEALSPVGARGLMQVMPTHEGKWKNCPPKLDGIEANICYGAQIFRWYLTQSGGQVETALLRYNGCVRGTNTPNCHEYPMQVFARAGRATLLARRVKPATGSD